MRYVKGFEGLYSVTSCGRVYSHITNRFLIPQKKKSGYLVVNLHKDGKMHQIRLHRLVASAYIENPNNLPYINHKDENPKNNCLQNLEWCDAKYNANYGTRNKRVSENMTNNPKISKKIICVETGDIYPSTREVERKLGIDHTGVSKCCRGILNIVGGYHWKYAEGD